MAEHGRNQQGVVDVNSFHLEGGVLQHRPKPLSIKRKIGPRISFGYNMHRTPYFVSFYV
jgi:hypothetical protein